MGQTIIMATNWVDGEDQRRLFDSLAEAKDYADDWLATEVGFINAGWKLEKGFLYPTGNDYSVWEKPGWRGCYIKMGELVPLQLTQCGGEAAG